MLLMSRMSVLDGLRPAESTPGQANGRANGGTAALSPTPVACLLQLGRSYFRGHPSALRAAGLSGARCGGFGEADARLITIGELDASRLECTL